MNARRSDPSPERVLPAPAPLAMVEQDLSPPPWLRAPTAGRLLGWLWLTGSLLGR